MSPDPRFGEVRALFDQLAGRPRAEQDVLLAAAPPEVRETVKRLLAVTTVGDAVFERPVFEHAAQRLGRYPVTRLIASGGMATVFEGQNPEDHTRVAIKLIRPGVLRDITLRRFRQEQWILGSLSHPHIATLLDTGATDDNRPFLVMEYLEGAPLTTWCEDRKSTRAERLLLFDQACQAVQYAHQQGVLHRDLKPDNILVASGVVKLLDFGIAKLLQEEPGLEAIRTTLGSRALTPEYASPEQIEGSRLGPATDVYSLGVVLFELLTGELPLRYDGGSLLAFTELVRTAVPPAPSRFSPSLKPFDPILDSALAKDPARRYATVMELQSALRDTVSNS